MNERIKELADKADDYADTYCDTIALSYSNWNTIRDAKFAELIVRECIKLCEHNSNDDEYDQFDMGQSVKAENIKASIMKEFGVEE